MVGTGTNEPGTWISLGTLDPTYGNWKPFGIKHTVRSGTYRLIYSSTDFTKIGSFGWIRAVYEINSEVIVSPSRRLSPKPENYLISFHLPNDLKAVGITEQSFQIKKVLRRTFDKTAEWTIALQELIVPDETPNAVSFYLILENASYTQDPEYPDLYISTFRERVTHNGKDIREFEVGRFYNVDTDEIVSDPQIEKLPYEIVCTFTQRRVIQPGELKVRIIY